MNHKAQNHKFQEFFKNHAQPQNLDEMWFC